MILEDFFAVMVGDKTPPENWDNILTEYVDLIRTPKSQTIFEAWNKIMYLDWQITFMDICIRALKPMSNGDVIYDYEIAEEISKLGFTLIEYFPERDKYLRQIYYVENEAKTLLVLLSQAQVQYKNICSSLDDPVTKTWFYYEKEIALLSKYQGQRIKKNKITVFEYCAIQNNYIEECELLKRQSQK